MQRLSRRHLVGCGPEYSCVQRSLHRRAFLPRRLHQRHRADLPSWPIQPTRCWFMCQLYRGEVEQRHCSDNCLHRRLHSGVLLPRRLHQRHRTDLSSWPIQPFRCWFMCRLYRGDMEQRHCSDNCVHRPLHRRVLLPRRLHQRRRVRVPCWSIQRGWRGGLQHLQRWVCVPCGLHQRHSRHLSCRPIQPRRSWGV
jgi:hypothetical protein